MVKAFIKVSPVADPDQAFGGAPKMSSLAYQQSCVTQGFSFVDQKVAIYVIFQGITTV